MYYLFLGLRMLSVVGGVFLICVRLFLYEQEHGKLQSKIEDLWNRLHEMHPRAIAQHLALMRALAHGVTVSFDNIFGVKVVSVESLMVTLCLCSSTTLVTLYFYGGMAQQEWKHESIWVALVYLGLGSLPLLIRLTFRKGRKATRLRRDASIIWLLVSVMVFLWRIVGAQIEIISSFSDSAFFSSFLIVIYGSVLIGVTAFFLSIVIIRRTFRAIEGSKSFAKPVFLCFLNLTPALIVFSTGAFFWTVLDRWPFKESLPPKLNSLDEIISLWASSPTFRTQVSIVLPVTLLILFELIFCLSALLFSTLGFFLIAHRLFWPTILRLLYASKRNEIVSKGRVLLILGALLIILGLGQFEWLIRVFE